jgi:hypothetical protein
MSFSLTQVIIWLLYIFIYNLILSPLSRFPGPKLWAASRIPSQISILRGHPHLDVLALHELYGPVVRIAPDTLAFNSAQAFRDIYSLRPGHQAFLKDRAEYTLPPNGVAHLVSALDDASHARQRRLMAPAFSERSIRALEGLVRGHVDTLIAKLRELKDKGELDIKSWMNYTTFDITGDFVFSEPFGCLEEGVLHPWIGLIFNAIKMASMLGVVNQFPLLNAALKRCIPKSLVQKSLDNFKFSAEKVDRRLDLQTERPDVISAILKHGLSEEEGQYEKREKVMSRSEIHSNAYM